MTYLTLLLHIPALFMTSLTQKVHDVFDTLATHSSFVHDVTDRGFMMYLTLLLHIPALFMTSLTQRVHDVFDTLATHSSLIHDITDTDGS